MEAVTDKLGGLGDLGSGAMGGISGGLNLPTPSNPVASPDEPASPMSPIPLGF